MTSPSSFALPNGLEFHTTDPSQLKAARFLAKEIFEQGFYARQGFELQPTDVVVDIGANMGMFALWAAPQVGDGRVVCIEPASCFDCLQRNLAENKLDHVTALKVAVGSEEGTLELVEYPGFNVVSHAAGRSRPLVSRFLSRLAFGNQILEERTVSCRCTTLETLANEQDLDHIDLLKIDCEGAEYDLFEAMSSDMFRRVRRMVIEFHHFSPSHHYRRLTERLEAEGFQTQVVKPLIGYYVLKTGTIWANRPTPADPLPQASLAKEQESVPAAAKST